MVAPEVTKNTNKRTTLEQLKLLAIRAHAADTALGTRIDGVIADVEDLVTAGGEPNKLEGVKVNGTALAIADKMVDLLVATGTANGAIAVNNVDVAVKGLAALAYKAQVSETDLDDALKAVIAAKATQTDLTALGVRVTTVEGKVTTLVGEDADKSVRAISAEEVAKIVANAPESYDTLKEIADWLSQHETDAAAMNSSIQDNKQKITALTTLVGTLPEGATSTTVVGYIAEAIAAIGIGDYAKTTEVTSAITTALADYYTKTEVDTKLTSYYTKTEINTTLEGYATDEEAATAASTAVTDATATDAEVTAMLDEVFGAQA